MFDFSLEDLIGMISVLSFGLIIVIVISPFFKTSYDRSFFLYIWHTLFNKNTEFQLILSQKYIFVPDL